jgi:chemotaxis protein MotB
MDEENNFSKEDDPISNEWLATYGDLVTLLMCFFVLLYSMAVIDQGKAKQVISSLNKMGILSERGDINSTVGNSILENTAIISQEQQQMDSIHDEVKKIIEQKSLQDDVEVKNEAKGVLIRFKDDLIYDVGSAELKPAAKLILTQISDILKKYNKNIKIEGHTDSLPIQSGKYESNWELSSARAISVVKFLSSELPLDKRIKQQSFEVSGYGEFRPIVPNDTEQNRQKNRRIEMLIIK